MFKKKSQISIFVILTTIIIIAGITIFLYSNDKILFFQDEGASGKIRNYVESCINQELYSSQYLLGENGGWIYKKESQKIFSKNTKIDYLNKQASGVSFLNIVDIPYSSYYDDSSKKFKYDFPTYKKEGDEFSIQNQIKKYLTENINKNCIRDFISFKDLYSIEYELNELNIIVDLENDEIISKVNLPIRIIDKEEAKTEYVNEFSSSTENLIYEPYYIAKDISIQQHNYNFLEKMILNILISYQGTNKNDLPPFSKLEFNKFKYVIWDLNEVKKNLKLILNTNINLVSFIETKNTNKNILPENLKDSKFANNLINGYRIPIKDNDENIKLSLDIEDYKKYEVNTKFFNSFPIFFTINGQKFFTQSDPKILNSFIIHLSQTEYNNNYELVIPIIFEIKNPNDKSNFVFKLAVETNIKNNILLKDYLKELNNFGLNQNQIQNSNSNGPSLICNKDLFDSGKYNFQLIDYVKSDLSQGKYGNVGIEKAQVYFNCAEIETCFIGNTLKNGIYSNNNITNISIKLPTNCEPGTLEIRKEGYKTLKIKNLNPKINEDKNLGTFGLNSKKEFEIQLNFKNKINGFRNLKSEENGFFFLKDLDDENNFVFVKFNFSNYENLKINLTTGNYEVSGFLIYDKEIVIPEKTFPGKSCGTFEFGCKEIPPTTINETKLPQFLSGGIKIENYTIDLNKINKNKIQIIFDDSKIPKSFDDLQNINNEFKGNIIFEE